jgi:hypothetical protein
MSERTVLGMLPIVPSTELVQLLSERITLPQVCAT